MSEAASPPAKGGELGHRRLGTPAAVAQALAIGPMFSTAIVLGFVSNPVNGAGWNTPLAVLIAGLGVLAIAYSISLFAKKYQGAGAIYEYLTRGAHPAVGIFAAGIFFTGTLFLGGGGIYLGLGILTQTLLAGAHLQLDRARLVAPRIAVPGAGACPQLPRCADRDRRHAHVRGHLIHTDAHPGRHDHCQGRRKRKHPVGFQPQHRPRSTLCSTASCSASCCSSASRPRPRSARRVTTPIARSHAHSSAPSAPRPCSSC